MYDGANMSAEKIAVVTGAGSGIGRAVAVTLQRNGFSIVLAGRREAELKRTIELCETNGADTLAVSTDVTNPEAVSHLFAEVHRRFGRVDVLFNNAGISAPSVPFEELNAEKWLAIVAVNLNGAFFCAQAAFRLMKDQQPRGGRIINNGSISAHVPRPLSAPYTATKHAITGLTKSIALDGRPYDIACSQIDIGNAATDMTAAMANGVLQADGTRRPEPVMDVQSVADAVLFVSDLPLTANVQFMTIMATNMPYVGRG